MAKNFYQQIETPEGEAVVHVNRRGCKGRWTKENDVHMRTLVETVQKMYREGKLKHRPNASGSVSQDGEE